MIIAEAGVNHNGSIKKAERLIEVASESGADYIKFQTFKAENLLIKSAEKAEYQKRNTSKNESQYEMIKKLELNREQHEHLINLCKLYSIEFVSSPFDLESIDLLNDLDVPFFKVPSGEMTNFPYLAHIALKNKPIIMSTGMATLDEVKEAIDVFLKQGLVKEKITLLHCNTEYPTPMKDVNLKAMLTMKDQLGIKVGYSDHTKGIEIAIAAVAIGARVIEKHFTLDNNLKGPDHKASLEPEELKNMVSAIRNIEKAIGDGQKRPSKSELKNIKIARKSIFAKKPIKLGEIFSVNNLTIKRPATGISPMFWEKIIGSKAKKNFKVNEPIKEN